jgi:hypothetical protein
MLEVGIELALERPIESVNPVRASRPSKPVGCSGAKNRWGRIHVPSSVVRTPAGSLRPGGGSVGDQSMASASIMSTSPSLSPWLSPSPYSGVCEEEEVEGISVGAVREGAPKIGLYAAGFVGSIGWPDKESGAKKSASGIGIGAGVL